MKKQTHQMGFTLIEALIAFVVLTVGILGTLLFHGELLGESASSKARLEALKIAESRIEELRKIVSTTSSGYPSTLSTAIASLVGSVSGINSNYLISIDSPWSVGVSGGDNMYSIAATVTWTDSATGSAVSVSVPTYFSWVNPALQIDRDDAGGGGSDAEYSGLIELPLGAATKLDRDIVSIAASAVGSFIESGAVISIAIDDGDPDGDGMSEVGVELVRLSAAGEKYVKIYGKVYEQSSFPADQTLKVGKSNGAAGDVAFGYLYQKEPDDPEAVNALIDVDALAGAACAIYQVGSNSSRDYAEYVCAAGQGWNGNINALIWTDGSNGLKTTATFCANYSRGYKYLIVEHINAALGAVIDDTTLASELAIKGQSGVVNFIDPNYTPSDYFWLNPYYLSQSDGTIYDQDFVVTEGGNVDCSGIAYSSFKTPAEYSIASAASEFTTDAKIYAGWPGEPSDSNNANFAVFNESGGDYARYSYKGDVVLGYAPYRYQVEGSLRVHMDLENAFELIGKPEPLVTVNCDAARKDPEVFDGTFYEYDYTCAVPKNWDGYIILRPNNNGQLGIDEIWNPNTNNVIYYQATGGVESLSAGDVITLNQSTADERTLAGCLDDHSFSDELHATTAITLGPSFQFTFWPGLPVEVPSGAVCTGQFP